MMINFAEKKECEQSNTNNQFYTINAKRSPKITSTPEIDTMLKAGAVVATGISGGKDSSIAALATNEYLDRIGHTGPRLLIHSDLGSVEWRQSLEICELVSARLAIPLIVVRRKSGGMLQRWQSRWAANVERYQQLLCVKLILPWSTPSMRFCTSELKTAIINAELARQFRRQTIINVTGIRRAESARRAKKPVFEPNKALSKTPGTNGYDWRPIIDLSTDEVFAAHCYYNFPLHEAYTTYGCTRVSCRFCIMSSLADLKASVQCVENQGVYREMCELEISSTFAFQSNQWLSDVAPQLLTTEQQDRLIRAKQIQLEREEIESRIPHHLLYEKGWPKVIPTDKEAALIAEVRREVAELQGMGVSYVTAEDVYHRYLELIEGRNKRQLKTPKERSQNNA
ncbi:MAG: phosphoadenosine phosphosulfate reductase family protein [Acidobacteriota bacterium]